MPAISINVIRVGSDQFTSTDLTTINNAVTVMRNIYATVGITLRRVENWIITTARANGRDVIDSNSEAEALTDEWTVPNNNVDVFVVKLYVGSVAGLSPCGVRATRMPRAWTAQSLSSSAVTRGWFLPTKSGTTWASAT